MNVVMLPVLVGTVALAIDVGYLFDYRRRMQTAADSAAVSAAHEILRNQATTSWATAAQEDATRNGFTNGADSTTVSVVRPPTSGFFAGNAGFVEVTITQPQPTWFMRVLGTFTTMTVGVRAVAGYADASGCIYALHPTASEALLLRGTAIANSPDCDVYVNSNHPNAFDVEGAACLSADSINVTGGESARCANPDPLTAAPPEPDPMAYLTPPPWNSCDVEGQILLEVGIHTLDPGVYCGGIELHSSANVTFNPGVYVIAGGGLTIEGADVTGMGVTFYITESAGYPYGGVVINGNSIVQLSAPTSGPWEAILFFQDPAIVSTIANEIAGGSQLTLEGVLYFPTTHVHFTGGGTAAGYTTIIASTVEFSGNVTLNTDYSGLASGSPIKRAALGE